LIVAKLSLKSGRALHLVTGAAPAFLLTGFEISHFT
jgi:hypothetical protein